MKLRNINIVILLIIITIIIRYGGVVDWKVVFNSLTNIYALSECQELTIEGSFAYTNAWLVTADSLLKNPQLTADEFLNFPAPTVTGYWKEVQGLNMEQAINKALKDAENIKAKIPFFYKKKNEHITLTKSIVKDIKNWAESNPDQPPSAQIRNKIQQARSIFTEIFGYCSNLFG